MKFWMVRIAVAVVAITSSSGAFRVGAQTGGGKSGTSTVSANGISGFWELSYDSRKVPPADLAPRVTKAVIEAKIKHDEHEIRYCNMLGTPFIMDQSRPIDIRQGASEVMIAADTFTQARHLYLRSAHIDPNIYDPSMNGDSIAHWEGDTLVVDTVGFSEDNGLAQIPGGGFRTAQSHLVERYRLVENGSILSVTFTWNDPTMYRTPHTYEFRYYRLPVQYQPLPMIPCNAYDEVRAKFLEGPGETVNHAISTR
jgi:hypothetical protein